MRLRRTSTIAQRTVDAMSSRNHASVNGWHLADTNFDRFYFQNLFARTVRDRGGREATQVTSITIN